MGFLYLKALMLTYVLKNEDSFKFHKNQGKTE